MKCNLNSKIKFKYYSYVKIKQNTAQGLTTCSVPAEFESNVKVIISSGITILAGICVKVVFDGAMPVSDYKTNKRSQNRD